MFKELNILSLFFNDPEREFNVREVGRILNIAPATASKELEKFSKRGLLKSREERNFKLYKSNIHTFNFIFCELILKLNTIL